MKEITTTNFADFGYSERIQVLRLISAWHEQGLPEGFYEEEVIPMMNRDSGYVFLTNSEYQVVMLNGSNLEIWHHCGNCGHEGFAEDCQLNDEGCNECNGE